LGSRNTNPADSPYVIVEQGANHRVVQNVSWIRLASGELRPRTNSYTELATGMAHPFNGKLVESSPEIQTTPNGAQAINGLHQVKFQGNINSAGAIDVTLPDGQHLVSNPLGICYLDKASGKSVMLAELKDAQGEILPTGRHALFRDAFTDFKADVLYEMSIAGLEQFVILRQKLPSPAELGLDPKTTMLQVITEFQNGPQPALTALEGEAGSDLRIDFGSMQMVRGVAFALGTEGNQVPVTKEWHVADGRTFLIEQVPLESVWHNLESLDKSSSEASAGPAVGTRQAFFGYQMPKARSRGGSMRPMEIARNGTQEKGFAMDYTLLTSQTNLTLQSDTTYLVSGTVNINGTLTIEGGTVVKYTNGGPVTITSTNVICKTGMYRVAVFTGRDDDSVGQKISGSTGNPSGVYGTTALDFSSAATVPVLSNLRFHYLSNALAGASITVQDVQFVQCANGFAQGSTQPTLYNVLAYRLDKMLANTNAAVLTAVNTTAHYCTNFFGNTNGTINFTNCLFVNVTNWYCANVHSNYSAVLTSDSGVFQSVGTGLHYLGTNNAYRNIGTTNINLSLLADLRKTTTYPPVVLTPSVNTNSAVFSIQAARDTDTPDLGVHYAPLDYALCAYFLTNATLTVTQAGTAIGVYGTTNYNYGVGLGGNAKLVVQGKANSLVEFVAFNTVQEQANTNWLSPSYGLITDGFSGADLGMSIRFADFSVLAQDTAHFSMQNSGTITLQDCQLHAGTATTTTPTVVLTNCLFERVYTDLEPNDGKQSIFRNNIFWRGSFYFWPTLSNSVVEANLFDKTTIQNISGYSYNGGFNAYVTNFDRLLPSLGTDIVLSNTPSYQVGPLGSYYLLSTSGLINVDTNRTANQVGLYHYTVMTNLVGSYEIKETNSAVDVSFHYVATDANGNPVDTDGDGTPDYIEDTNGDGIFDAGDLSNWLALFDVDRFLRPGRALAGALPHPWLLASVSPSRKIQ
jgi:hypothetical protein